jgi:hypothetical protein
MILFLFKNCKEHLMNFEYNIQVNSDCNTSVVKKIYSIFDFAYFKRDKVVYYDIEKNEWHKRDENKTDEELMLDLV